MADRRMRSRARPVLAPAWRRPAGWVALACALTVLAFGVAVHRQRSGTGFDDAVDSAVARRLSRAILQAALHLTDPPVIVALLALVAVLAALRRNWPVLVVTLASPVLALVLTEFVLKPSVHRIQEGALAYPSGHESAPGCLAAILSLLVLRSSWRAGVKVAALGGLVAYLVVCAVAVIGNLYHYATDTVAAVLLSIACVLTTALIADRQLT